MPRIKVDFYDRRQDAVDALSALRDVGLNPGDIGGAWLADGVPDDDSGTGSVRQTVAVSEIGEVEFTGWLGGIARDASTDRSPVTLATVLGGDGADTTELLRIHETLLAGGGIIGVRARDAFTSNPD